MGFKGPIDWDWDCFSLVSGFCFLRRGLKVVR